MQSDAFVELGDASAVAASGRSWKLDRLRARTSAMGGGHPDAYAACVGACLFRIVSAFGFADSLSAQHVVLDSSRVAAQVVSGIGFLGAGAILAHGEIMRGLTTAASIWTVAAIGLAVGGRLYFAAGLSTTIILAILAGVKPLEEAYRDRNQTRRLVIETARGALTPVILKDALKVRNGPIKRFLAMARCRGGRPHRNIGPSVLKRYWVDYREDQNDQRRH